MIYLAITNFSTTCIGRILLFSHSFQIQNLIDKIADLCVLLQSFKSIYNLISCSIIPPPPFFSKFGPCFIFLQNSPRGGGGGVYGSSVYYERPIIEINEEDLQDVTYRKHRIHDSELIIDLPGWPNDHAF